VDHVAGQAAVSPAHIALEEAFDLEEVRGLEGVHIDWVLSVAEDLAAEAEKQAAKEVPCLVEVPEVQMVVFQVVSTYRSQLEEEAGRAVPGEEADVPAHFQDEGEGARE